MTVNFQQASLIILIAHCCPSSNCVLKSVVLGSTANTTPTMNELHFDGASAEELIEMIKQNSHELSQAGGGTSHDVNQESSHSDDGSDNNNNKRRRPSNEPEDETESSKRRNTVSHHDVSEHDASKSSAPVHTDDALTGGTNHQGSDDTSHDIFAGIEASEQFRMLQQLEPDVLEGINLEELQKELDRAEKEQQQRQQAKDDERHQDQNRAHDQVQDQERNKIPDHATETKSNDQRKDQQEQQLQLQEPVQKNQQQETADVHVQPAASKPHINEKKDDIDSAVRAEGARDSHESQAISSPQEQQPKEPEEGAVAEIISPTEHIGTFIHNIPDCILKMRRQSLPMLDCLAMQILNVLSSGNYKEVAPIVTHPDSEPYKALQATIYLFEQTKGIYTTEAFLTSRTLVDVSKPHNPAPTRSQRITIQRTNLATFMAGVFGFVQVGFYHLNENFMDSFVAPSNRLLKSLMPLFLELKTHAFISGMNNGEQDATTLLDELFPENNEKVLFGNRKGRAPFSSEMEFIAQCKERRAALQKSELDESSKKLSWLTFVKDISEYVGKSMSSIIPPAPPTTPQPIVHARTSKPPLIVNARPTNGTAAPVPVPVPVPVAVPAPIKRPVARGKKPTEKSGPPASVTLQSFNALKQKQKSHSVPQRAGWTIEQERALLDCMDKVQGPFWDRVAKLCGKSGTISSILQDKSYEQMSERFHELKKEFPEFGIRTPPLFQVAEQQQSTTEPKPPPAEQSNQATAPRKDTDSGSKAPKTDAHEQSSGIPATEPSSDQRKQLPTSIPNSPTQTGKGLPLTGASSSTTLPIEGTDTNTQ